MNEIKTLTEYETLREQAAIARLCCKAGKDIGIPRRADVDRELSAMSMAGSRGEKALPKVTLSDAGAFLRQHGLAVPAVEKAKFTQ